jgi:hypothetical protein
VLVVAVVMVNLLYLGCCGNVRIDAHHHQWWMPIPNVMSMLTMGVRHQMDVMVLVFSWW